MSQMKMYKKNIFRDIIQHKVTADIVYQDDLVTAFSDINPLAPVHVLIVPNILIPTVNDITKKDEVILGRLFTVAAKVAIQKRISVSGYRLIVNCNDHAGQEIYHLHMHLLGGRELGPLLTRI